MQTLLLRTLVSSIVPTIVYLLLGLPISFILIIPLLTLIPQFAHASQYCIYEPIKYYLIYKMKSDEAKSSFTPFSMRGNFAPI